VDVLEYLLLPLRRSEETPELKSKSKPNQTIDGGGIDGDGIDGDGIDGDGIDDGIDSPATAIFRDTPAHRAVDLPVTRCKKSLGRTPLHYACRNGCLESVRWLVYHGGEATASVHARQKVTPFQLAVWQNRLEICRFLVEVGNHDAPNDFNEFGCGPVHWLGIAPGHRANLGNDNDDDNYDDGRDLLPLAEWLAALPGIDFNARQRQNHTALHKAAWGGHLALVRYLHREHGMWDDVADHAGNYAASLADMANTPRHGEIAAYLRHHCSRKRAESLEVLGLRSSNNKEEPKTFGRDEIRRAYLTKARQLHPDRLLRANNGSTDREGTSGKSTGPGTNHHHCPLKEGENNTNTKTTTTTTSTSTPENKHGVTFDALQKAYLHLTEEDGVGDQSNPAHSLNLMLQYVNNNNNNNINESTNQHGSARSTKHNQPHGERDEEGKDRDDDTFFKARLVAVLLEYGDKGIDLSNVKKKWKQVWPKVPFPSQQQQQIQSSSSSSTLNRKIPMAEFLMQRAGDVIRFERHGDRNRRVLVLLRDRNSSREAVLRGSGAQ